jgi:uncharacterized protein
MAGRGANAGSEGGFDALALAGQRQQLAGSVDARALPRAAEWIAGAGPVPLDWRIVGTTDARGRPALAVVLEGSVPLECQRCLRVFSWPVEQRTLLLLAGNEDELARLDEIDEHEVVLAAVPQEALALVEDELLLTLPFVPRCGEGQCEAAPADDASSQGTVPSAFAALAGMQTPAPKQQKRRN